MRAVLAVATAYAFGYAFWLGIARGRGDRWPDALAFAAIWPLGMIWMRFKYGTFLPLLLLLVAAPAGATYTLRITTSGPVSLSTVITSTPSGIVCPSTCTASFTENSTVTIGAVWKSTIAFVGWGAPCRTNQPSCTLTLSAATTVTAKFDPTLDLSFFGTGIGSVRASSQVFVSTGGAPVRLIRPAGTTVILYRSTGTQSAFAGWTSSGGGCSTASTCTVTMSTYTTVVATFTPTGTVGVSSYTLKVVVPNGGGIVRSSPTGISCGTSTTTACTANFVAGGTVRLSTEALAGYRFAGWANGGCRGLNPCVITSTSPLQGLGGKWSPAAYFYGSSP